MTHFVLRKILGIFILFVFSLFTTPALFFVTHAATFYVSTTSDGTGTVNNISDPYPSVRTAVYAAFSHSDTSSEVIIRGGTYNQSENIFQRDFTAAGKSVLIKAYPEETSYFYPTDYLISGIDYGWRFVGPSTGISIDATADGGAIIIDGSNMLSTELTDNKATNARALHDKGLLQLSGSDFSVKGLEIRNSHGRGVQFTNSNNVTIENNTIYNIKTRAIGGSGDTITITGNTVYNAVLENYNQAYNQSGDGSNDPDDGTLGDSCGGWAGAISTVKIDSTTATTNVVISNNTVYDNWGEGIIPFDSRYVEITGNTVYNNYSVNMYVEAVQDAVVDRNYVYQTTGTKTRNQNADCPDEPARETYGISVANEARVVDGVPEVVAYTDKMAITNNLVIGGEASLRFWFDESNTATTNSYKNLLIAHNVFWKPVGSVLLIGCVVAQDSGASCTHEITGDQPENARFINNLVSRGTATYGTINDPTAWTFSHNHWVEGEPTFANITHTNSTTGDPELLGETQAAGDSTDNFKIADTSALAQSGLDTTGLVPNSIEIWLPDTNVKTDYFNTSYLASSPSRGFHEQEPAPEPSPTPTPTPTPNSDSQGNASETHNSSSGTQMSSCAQIPPVGSAQLFEVRAQNGSATIFFSPANSHTTLYHVQYFVPGYSDAVYADTFSTTNASGVLEHTVHHLAANTQYSFSIQPHNGCAAGNWSNQLTAKTPKNTEKKQWNIFYLFGTIKQRVSFL